MKRKQKKLLIRIGISAALFIAAVIISETLDVKIWLSLAMFFLPYFISGYDVILSALRNIVRGQIFDENFLMCIATVGAFAIGEYPEAVFVMLFYQIGELFQSIAVGKSRRSISALMDIKPDQARVLRNGQEITVSPDEVGIGEAVIVRAGEKIPLDGTVISGTSELNCMALTGESAPKYIEKGMTVTGGCINLSGILKIEVSSKYEDSTVSRILELVENAASVKSKTDKLITRFARYYTPFVVISAFLLVLIPTLITGDFADWLGRALVFLVISCPCALVISVPLSYFGGIGAASKKGILVKGALYLEALAEAETVVFDKTGTLTKGVFEVSEVKCFNNEEKLFAVAAALEANSNHPVAKAVYEYSSSKACVNPKLREITEKAGYGVVGLLEGKKYFAGNIRLLNEFKIKTEEIKSDLAVVYVGSEDGLIGYFVVKDELKDSSREAIKALKSLGISQTVMLSGDREECVSEIAKKLSLDKAVGELMPDSKIAELEKIICGARKGKKVVYVGDGINDAPVISRADVGISMGALGSDAAIEAADVVLMDDNPQKVAEAIGLAKKTKRIVIENIVFALGVKLAFMVLGAMNIAGLWLAVFADVGVSVIAILNAMRTLKQ